MALMPRGRLQCLNLLDTSMIKAIYGVYGASGFGREVLPHVRKYLLANHVSLENLYFIDDGLNSTFVNGCNVVTYSQFRAIEAKNKFVSIAIADKDIRRKLSIKIIADGVVPLSVVSDKAEVLDEVKIGQGHILCSNVTITSNVKIGTFFQANIDSYVAHDCVIGDFVTFAPKVCCNGNVVIEDDVYIGTGAIIKQGKHNKPLTIGRGAIVAAGSFVTKNVAAGLTVFGNPAKVLSKENLKH
jgi:sugar O-acyltransferase (sialic acid O-acetyltransferase NeuD family)